MNSNFQKALNFVLQHECTYAPGHDGDMAYVVTENVPGDGGGLTKYGIDEKDHPGVDIADLTEAQAAAIYQNGEWAQCRCDELPAGFDIAMFDIAVNNGAGTAIRLLQESLNESAGLHLAEDGVLGPETMEAVAEGWPGALRRLLLFRQHYYYDIVTLHPGQGEFLKGWIARNNSLAALLGVNLNAIQ